MAWSGEKLLKSGQDFAKCGSRCIKMSKAFHLRRLPLHGKHSTVRYPENSLRPLRFLWGGGLLYLPQDVLTKFF